MAGISRYMRKEYTVVVVCDTVPHLRTEDDGHMYLYVKAQSPLEALFTPDVEVESPVVGRMSTAYRIADPGDIISVYAGHTSSPMSAPLLRVRLEESLTLKEV